MGAWADCVVVCRAGRENGCFMKQLLSALAIVGILLLLSPRGVGAAPVEPCPVSELLTLTPLEAFENGALLTRSSTGRYVTDAGLEFDLERAEATALEGKADPQSGCSGASNTVQLEIIDPFSGASHRVTLEVAP